MRSSMPLAGALPRSVNSMYFCISPISLAGQYGKGGMRPTSSCSVQPIMRQKAGLT